MVKKVIFCLFLLHICNILICQTSEEMFASGIERYNEGNYAEAASIFESLYSDGNTDFEVCYNLGNAYYKSDDMPSAILFYERALRLRPGDENTIYNLSIANSRIIDKIDTVPELFFAKWFKSVAVAFTPAAWSVMSIVLFFLLCTGVFFVIILRRLTMRKVFFYLSTIVLLLFVFVTFMNVKIRHNMMSSDTGIVFSPTVTVKGSPSDEGIDLFVIHSGTKVFVSQTLGDWDEIKLSNGKTGWVQSEVLKKI